MESCGRVREVREKRSSETVGRIRQCPDHQYVTVVKVVAPVPGPGYRGGWMERAGAKPDGDGDWSST